MRTYVFARSFDTIIHTNLQLQKDYLFQRQYVMALSGKALSALVKMNALEGLYSKTD